MSTLLSENRVTIVNGADVRKDGEYVLYWMIAHRRTNWNFSLDRALEWSKKLAQPLVILEALRCDYPWASDRLHWFVMAGMSDNAEKCERAGVLYYPYLEPSRGAGKGLLAAMASEASLVITDDFPTFFLPRMVDAAGKKLDVRLEMVDANGLFPMRLAEKEYPTAYSFRGFLQKHLPDHLLDPPAEDPFSGYSAKKEAKLPKEVFQRWPMTETAALTAEKTLADLPIDHSVRPAHTQGGSKSGQARLDSFIAEKLSRYDEERNHPEADATSGLSPYLHFGHISVHQVFDAIVRHEGWTPSDLSDKTEGKRSGWWGMSASAEAFLDEVVTWRELGYNMCSRRSDYDQYDSLPQWAQETLAEHADDPREHTYSLEEFERSATHDELWNAAQNQLRIEGRIHNYLRMLWGKKILHWSDSPQTALEIMIELNNKYALDGRNPNSYSGIFWVLGRYDRPWGPERPIFGKIRYMTSDNTARKFSVKDYISEYAKVS